MKSISPVISSNFSIFLNRAFILSPHSSRSAAGPAWLSEIFLIFFHVIWNRRTGFMSPQSWVMKRESRYVTSLQSNLLDPKLSATYWAKTLNVSRKPSGVLLKPSELLNDDWPLMAKQIVPQLLRIPDVLAAKLHLLLSAKLLHSLIA